MEIANSIEDVIGNTPLVKLNKVTEGCVATILAKLESQNPASSVKDRLAKGMIQEAEKRGEIKPGDTLVELSSGNTGIGLAMLAAVKGYNLVIVLPENYSMERRLMLRAFGAEIILVGTTKTAPELIAFATKIAKDRGGKMLNQFANLDNPKIHRDTTGPEIWNQTSGNIDFFVSGVGTGGTFTGTTQYLKSVNPSLKAIAVEPAESQVLAGKPKGPHTIQGIGAGFIPEIMDISLCDEIIPCHSDNAMIMARRLALEEGMMVGISSGAAVQAAIEVGKRPENQNKVIVVIIPSFGERYLSTLLFKDLMDECKDMPITEISE